MSLWLELRIVYLETTHINSHTPMKNCPTRFSTLCSSSLMCAKFSTSSTLFYSNSRKKKDAMIVAQAIS